MDEISRIATEALLPPVKVVDDRSCFSNNLRNEWSTKTNLAVGTLKRLISDCLFPSKEEWTTNNKDVFQLLILCGEHSLYSEWNTQELVNNVNELLDITLSKLGVQSIQDIFAVTSVTHSILQHLKPKLGKAEIKAYPAAVNCFVWVVTNTLVPSLDESVDLAVPISLVLFDEWEPDYQQKGLECMYHILKEKPPSLLPRGWLAVIFSTLKKNPAGSSDKLKLFKSLDFCLKSLNVDPTDPSSWNLNDQYDSLVNDLIQSMMIQDSPDVTKRNLEILVVLFQSMQIKMAKFLPLIISALDTHITDGVASDIILLSIKVMEHIIEYCWACLEPQFTNQLAWILFKLGSETENEEVDAHLSISKCNDLLKQISSSHSVLS